MRGAGRRSRLTNVARRTQNVDPLRRVGARSTLCGLRAQNVDHARRPSEMSTFCGSDTNADSASPRGGRAALVS